MGAMLAHGDETNLVTRTGHDSLRSELATLSLDGRSELIERLRQARNDGDLADNPALYALLEEQAQLEQRIAQLEAQLASARVAEPNDDGTAGVGNYVRLRDLGTNEVVEYELVGAIETDVGNGRVSVDAPVGRALLGAEAGQVVEVATPRGGVRLEVLEVGPLPVRKAA